MLGALCGLVHVGLRFTLGPADLPVSFGAAWLVNGLGWCALVAAFVTIAEIVDLARGRADDDAKEVAWSCGVLAACFALATWAVIAALSVP